METPVICYGCGNSFVAMRVTASLKCARCGSDDLDLDLNAHTASGGTGWGKPMPDRLQGWNDYQGPLPGRNPRASEQNTPSNNVCPACNGTGQDTRASGGGYNEIPCRLCHGTGQYATHADSPGSVNDGTTQGPEIGGARYTASASPRPFSPRKTYNYTVTSGRRSSDPMGSADDYIRGTDPDYDNRSGAPRKADTRSPAVQYRKNHDYPHSNGPLPLPGAACPSCGLGQTQLVRDAKDDAWWHCPDCGPLANVDKNPEINPFEPPEDFSPDRKMKTKVARFRKQDKTGKVLKMARDVLHHNPGLTNGQALTLVRNALLKFPENDR